MSGEPIRISTVAQLNARDERLRARPARQPDPPLHPNCKKCGHPFFDHWEQMKHEVLSLHGYRSWTPEDDRRQQVRADT